MPIGFTDIGRICALLAAFVLSSCGSGSANTDQNSSPAIKTHRANPSVCHQKSGLINWLALARVRCNLLSNYRLFGGYPNQISSSNGGIYYQLNSELFTDHARKYRYIYLPDNTKIGYQLNEPLDFPVGTVLVKVFALPDISTDKSSEKIIEVRLMVHRKNGWIFIPYVWDDSIKDARLAIGGSKTPIRFAHKNEHLDFTYESPSLQRCGHCHQIKQNNKTVFLPIGPKTRHLNRSITVDNKEVNQLEHWQSLRLIELSDNASKLPYAPDWRDKSAPLQDRAKAYLDINCAYCHNPNGAASLSGLRLDYSHKSLDRSHGVCNSSHGWRGGGFDIWPGRGEKSSIPRRMQMNEAADRMPPIGRAVSDDDAVKLMQKWIDSMPPQECTSG